MQSFYQRFPLLPNTNLKHRTLIPMSKALSSSVSLKQLGEDQLRRKADKASSKQSRTRRPRRPRARGRVRTTDTTLAGPRARYLHYQATALAASAAAMVLVVVAVAATSKTRGWARRATCLYQLSGQWSRTSGSWAVLVAGTLVLSKAASVRTNSPSRGSSSTPMMSGFEPPGLLITVVLRSRYKRPNPYCPVIVRVRKTKPKRCASWPLPFRY